ncbi:MAG: TIGR03905 family TSCPD domain-containing protein [Ruminococcaceae bacterium]|nr:TIGR03905 family TSCPD domain-containing protein [Oscillospiraceae bacterium]
MRYNYQTKGVCSRTISFDIENGIISNVKFEGGCNGNLKAISRLVDGKNAEEISAVLAGNTCGMKNTSCADQLSKAINEALKEA